MSETELASFAEDAAKAAAAKGAARMMGRGPAAAAAEVEDEGAEISADGDRSRRACDSERIDEASQEGVFGFRRMETSGLCVRPRGEVHRSRSPARRQPVVLRAIDESRVPKSSQ